MIAYCQMIEKMINDCLIKYKLWLASSCSEVRMKILMQGFKGGRAREGNTRRGEVVVADSPFLLSRARPRNFVL